MTFPSCPGQGAQKLVRSENEMASRHWQVHLLATAVIAVVFLPALASATDYVVGDKAGWTLNYAIGWPAGKTFKVNDNLVFNYHPGNHTVTEVDGQTFRDCDRHGNTIKQWSSGNDTIKLDKPGTRWFFCSVADHCEMGLKLVINVVGAEAPSSPAPSLPPNGSPSPGSPPKPATPSPQPSPPTDPTTSTPSSSAATNHMMTAGASVARAMVMTGAAVVAACFI